MLADGRVIRTGGRSLKTAAGYDLTDLLIGSAGTLAVITELTIRLHGIPEQTLAARAVFADVDAACRTATSLIALGGCSGEHGIGMGKIGRLQREHGDLVPVMQRIKSGLDPNWILNPGKVVSEPARENHST